MPVKVVLEKEEEKKEDNTKGRKKKESDKNDRGASNKKKKRQDSIYCTKQIIDWREKAKERYRTKTKEIGQMTNDENSTIDRIQERLKDLVKKSLVYKKRMIRKRDLRYKVVGQKLYQKEEDSQKDIPQLEERKRNERKILSAEERFKELSGKKEKKNLKKRRKY